MKIAFVGTGVMGQGMVANLLKAGHEVTVHTRTKAKADGLLALGAKWASSPAESARGADIAVSMVGYPNDVEEVWRGPQGFMSSAQPGCVLVDMTTSSPALARSLATEAAAKGFGPLDAPVSGGDRGAREGTLTIMAGGAQQAFDFGPPWLPPGLIRGGEQPRDHRVGQYSLAEPPHLRGQIAAAGPGLGRVGFQFRVDQHSRRYPVRVPRDDVLNDIPTHRNASDHHGAFHMKGIKQGHRVVGQLDEALRSTLAAATEAAEVGDYQPDVISKG